MLSVPLSQRIPSFSTPYSATCCFVIAAWSNTPVNGVSFCASASRSPICFNNSPVSVVGLAFSRRAILRFIADISSIDAIPRFRRLRRRVRLSVVAWSSSSLASAMASSAASIATSAASTASGSPDSAFSASASAPSTAFSASAPASAVFFSGSDSSSVVSFFSGSSSVAGVPAASADTTICLICSTCSGVKPPSSVVFLSSSFIRISSFVSMVTTR
ncbi:hypothetical protein Mm0Y_03833 [Morganella morganii]|nr:hypothetical protein Mm0Y_03833 [Morganella morganii]